MVRFQGRKVTNTTCGPTPSETRPEKKLDTCYFLLVDNCNIQDNYTQSTARLCQCAFSL